MVQAHQGDMELQSLKASSCSEKKHTRKEEGEVRSQECGGMERSVLKVREKNKSLQAGKERERKYNIVLVVGGEGGVPT